MLNMSGVNSELSELRSVFKHQSSKMNLIELNVTNITTEIASSKSTKDQIIARIDNLEYGLNDTRRQYGDIGTAQSDISLKVKKISNSLKMIQHCN
jgi:hypothetical protein